MPTWTADLRVGVADIDAQHEELFRRADLLDEALSAGGATDAVSGLFTYLERYCVEHFATERRLMLAERYPALHLHLGEHEWFARELRRLRVSFGKEASREDASLRLDELVLGWLVNHVATTDRDVAAFLQAR